MFALCPVRHGSVLEQTSWNICITSSYKYYIILCVHRIPSHCRRHNAITYDGIGVSVRVVHNIILSCLTNSFRSLLSSFLLHALIHFISTCSYKSLLFSNTYYTININTYLLLYFLAGGIVGIIIVLCNIIVYYNNHIFCIYIQEVLPSNVIVKNITV